ncbi:MAG: CDP-alcohol phosphatidyltransferase family protein [Methanosarcinaceae archaeon]|nr:CDP-alcohol phosphatidyltransferase family protein [Methanosarcinaceae archaeon]
MTIDALRPFASGLIEPIARSFADRGISPDAISFASLVFALLAGICYYYSMNESLMVVAAVVFVALNSFFDALDGAMARYLRITSKRGDFLDHVIDRYSDVFIICGIFFAGYIHWQLGVVAIVGVLLTSYLGTQAQALDIGRFYGGIMGRADRLVLIMLASVVHYAYPHSFFGYPVLGWTIVIIAVGSHITALQRIAHIWKQL